MNQKNIFSVIAVVLILQGIGFYIMGDQVVRSSFANLDDNGYSALQILMEVMAALSIIVGLFAYATRTTPGVVGAFTLGMTVLLLITLKHKFVDDINVPLPAMVIQVLIVLACGYLLTQSKKA